ncbi:MAG: sigma-70 factor domain-containing protein [Methylobacter sp.]|nr:sigma-70 factor domain-containing protein [Methylobacter sp.]
MKAELVELLDDNVCVFNEHLSFDDDPQTHSALNLETDESVIIDAQHDKSMDATRVYLNELARSQLLTADQEKLYGSRALLGDEVTSHYPQVAAARIKSDKGGILFSPSSLSLR